MFFKNFGIGLAGALVVAAQQYLQGADFTELGIWSAVAGAVAALIAKALGKLVAPKAE